jgi:tRNA 2-thiouridine synthesizing protein C
MKKIAVVLTQSAFMSHVSREAQDLAMALTAVEHQVTLIYLGTAVTQLLPLSTAENFGVKDFTLGQKLFGLYDIEQVVVAEDAMLLYQLVVNDLRIDAAVLATPEISALLLQQDHILRC